MEIEYRNYTDTDIDNIIEFWNENSGWETDMNRNEFAIRFCSSPYGKPIIMLAIEKVSNLIMGQFCFIPVEVTIKGNNLLAYRPFGAVIRESFRKQFGLMSFLTGKHPINILYNKGAEEARLIGASLTYLIPDPRWGKILKVFPFLLYKFPLYSLQLPFPDFSDFGNNTSFRKLEPFDKQIDNLWAASKDLNQCTVTKDSVLYQTKIKISHGKVKLYGAFSENMLIGIFTLQYKDDGNQWLIGDIVSKDNNESLSLTIQNACKAAQNEYAESLNKQEKIYKIAVLSTPPIAKVVNILGFHKEDYTFTFAVHNLNNNKYSKQDTAPENWYVSAND